MFASQVRLCVIAALLVWPWPPCDAAEPAASDGEHVAGIDLLRADSLARCQPPVSEAPGWTLTDGKLTGTAGCEPLAWPRPLENFELQMTWSVSADGALGVRFPNPEGKHVELRLSEDPGVTIKMPQGARSLKIPEDTKGKPHNMLVRISGDKFRLVVDGAKSKQLPIDVLPRSGITLTVEQGSATVELLCVVDLAASPAVPME